MAHKRSAAALKAIKDKRYERRRLAKEKVRSKMTILQDFLRSDEFLSLGELPGLSNLEKDEVREFFDYTRVKVVNCVDKVIQEDLDDVYSVEKIVDFGLLVSQEGGKGSVSRIPCYLVKWVGYQGTTWEPMVRMEDCVAVTEFWASQEVNGTTKFRALFKSKLI